MRGVARQHTAASRERLPVASPRHATGEPQKRPAAGDQVSARIAALEASNASLAASHADFRALAEARLCAIEQAQRRMDAEFEMLRKLLCEGERGEGGSVATELVSLLKTMRRGIRVNSEAVLQQDEQVRELLRHLHYSTQYGVTGRVTADRSAGAADGERELRQEQQQSLADLREQLQHVERAVSLQTCLSTSALLPATSAAAVEDVLRAQQQQARASEGAASAAQASAESAELAARAAARALEHGLEERRGVREKAFIAAHVRLDELDVRLDALQIDAVGRKDEQHASSSELRRQLDEVVATEAQRARGLGEWQRQADAWRQAHASRLDAVDALATGTHALCHQLAQRLDVSSREWSEELAAARCGEQQSARDTVRDATQEAFERRLSGLEHSLWLVVAGLNRSTRIWEGVGL